MPRCGYCDNDCSPTAKMCPQCGDDLGATESERPWDNQGQETIFDKAVKTTIVAIIIVFFFIVLLYGG
jgi:hypothetical protein